MVRWRKEDEVLGEEEGKMEFVRCLKKIKRELQGGYEGERRKELPSGSSKQKICRGGRELRRAAAAVASSKAAFAEKAVEKSSPSDRLCFGKEKQRIFRILLISI